MAASCLLHIAVDGEQSSCGRAFSSFVVELALSNFPGIYYTEPPGSGSPFGVYWPAVVPQSVVGHVVVHADGRREEVPVAPADPAVRAETTKAAASASCGTCGTCRVCGTCRACETCGAERRRRTWRESGDARYPTGADR